MKDIKNGNFTCYKGVEYRLVKRENGNYNLISHDKNDLLFNGFFDVTSKYSKKPIYIKKIDLSELGEIYRICTVAIYHGLSVGIESYTEDKVLLATSDKIFYEKYGFEEVERNVYMKEVPFEDVELVDKRSVVTNFFK